MLLFILFSLAFLWEYKEFKKLRSLQNRGKIYMGYNSAANISNLYASLLMIYLAILLFLQRDLAEIYPFLKIPVLFLVLLAGIYAYRFARQDWQEIRRLQDSGDFPVDFFDGNELGYKFFVIPVIYIFLAWDIIYLIKSIFTLL